MNREEKIRKARESIHLSLIKRPYSRAEIIKKLRQKRLDSLEIREIIADLEEKGYINDLDFALKWSYSRVPGKCLGRIRLESELRQKGIAPEIISQVQDEVYIKYSEFELAGELLERKFHGVDFNEADPKEKKRAFGLLQRHGFTSEIIQNVMMARLD
jgi:regulatory protein